MVTLGEGLGLVGGEQEGDKGARKISVIIRVVCGTGNTVWRI